MAQFRFRVSDAESGERLDRILAARPEITSRGLAERLIGDGSVSVDGTPRSKSSRPTEGAEVVVRVPEDAPLAPEELDVPILFEDEYLLVVDKPAGIVVHPSGGHRTGTLVQGLVAHGIGGGDADRPGIVHRLDRDTSGLLLVARSAISHRRLQAAIRRRAVTREYLALVHGVPRSRTGRITAPIGRDRRHRTRYSLDTETPRNAITWFETVERIGPRTLLEIRLETGRTHQIRVHLEAIGLPVCGDRVYGAAGDLALERQFLHAHRLTLTHPFTGAALEFTSALPGDLTAALGGARADL